MSLVRPEGCLLRNATPEPLSVITRHLDCDYSTKFRGKVRGIGQLLDIPGLIK